VLLHRLGWTLAALYKLFGSRTDLLNLAKGSPELDKLHDGFLSSYKAIVCICFYECVPEYTFGISIGPVFAPASFSRALNNHLYVKVVDEKSATIAGNPDNIGLEADHRGINKFGSRADPNYLKVLEKLRRLVDDAPAILKRGTAASQ
jgi:hypothetical protein